MDGKFYIYKITNLTNGKLYIGKTSRPNKRWQQHISLSNNPKDRRYQYIHRAIRKYGTKNFSFEIIDSFKEENECFKYETIYINNFNSNNRKIGYNLTTGGDGATGYHHTKKSKQKMSLAKLGVFEGNKNPFYGKKHTQKVRKILSEKAKLRTGKNNPFYGKTHNKETLINIRKTKIKNGTLGKKKYLTEQQISDVRSKYATGNYTYSQLGKEYLLHNETIKNIITYKRAYAKK